MAFEIKLSKDLTIDIRRCPHLLIVGKGDNNSNFAEQLEMQIDTFHEVINKDISDTCNTECIGVDFCLDGCFCEHKEQLMNERYELLFALNFNNIEQFNEHFKYEDMRYHVLFASLPTQKQTTFSLKQILMKGRGVGIYVVMFINDITDLGDNVDLLDMFPAKVIYKANDTDESVLLTGYKGAESLRDNEFMFCELGKQPVIYESELL